MRFIIPIIFLLISIYLGTGFLVYTIIFATAFYCLNRGDKFLPLALFFGLLYLLPYSLNQVVLGHSWGAYLDNNFLAGIPLYATIPLYFNKWFPLNKKLQIILALFLVAFLASTVIPGFLSLVGLGGYRVRFSDTLNYFNSFLVGVLAYTVFTSERNISRFTDLIMLLAIIAAVGGLLQYIFGPFFYDPSDVVPNRLIIIPVPDAVSLFPFFIVPFAFALNQLSSGYLRKKALAYLTVSILLVASLLTWSRWGIVVFLIMILSYFIITKKSLKFFVILTIVTFAISFILSEQLFLQIVPDHQKERFSGATSLFTRITLWGLGLSLLNDVWLFGVGVGNTVKLVFSYSPHPIINPIYYSRFNFETVISIHQFFLDWFINQGITAMFGLAGLYYYIVKHFRIVEKYLNNDVVRRFSRSIFLSLLGLTLFWMQNSGDAYYYLFMFLGASFAIRKLVLMTYREVSKTELVSMKSLV